MIDEDVLQAMDNDAKKDLQGEDLMFALEVTRLARLGVWAEKWAIEPIKHYAKFLEQKMNLQQSGLSRAVDELEKLPEKKTEH